MLEGWPRSGRVGSSLVQGTYEAACQKIFGTIDSIGIMRAPFDKGAPRSGGGTNKSKPFLAVSAVKFPDRKFTLEKAMSETLKEFFSHMSK